MTVSEFDRALQANVALALYFFNDSCQPCKILRPAFDALMKTDFSNISVQYINAASYPELAAHCGVFSAPTILFFFEGKEYIREGKNISMSELREKVGRYYRMIF